jgi:uncharacterized membrane protein
MAELDNMEERGLKRHNKKSRTKRDCIFCREGVDYFFLAAAFLGAAFLAAAFLGAAFFAAFLGAAFFAAFLGAAFFAVAICLEFNG